LRVSRPGEPSDRQPASGQPQIVLPVFLEVLGDFPGRIESMQLALTGPATEVVEEVTLYRDLNEDGQLNTNDEALTNPVTVSAESNGVDFEGGIASIPPGQSEQWLVGFSLKETQPDSFSVRPEIAAPSSINAQVALQEAAPMSVVGEFPVEGDLVTTDPTDDPGDDDDPAAVAIPDPQLKATLLDALGEPPDGQVTRSDLQELTELIAEDAGITRLDGLEGASGLQVLDLGSIDTGNAVTDLEPLSSLTQLRELDLGGQGLSGLSPLQGLTNLEILALYQNEISDLSPLNALTNLQELDLFANRISDPSPLSALTALTWLHLGSNQIEDGGPLTGLSNLQFLDLSANRLQSIDFLGALTQLQQLRLQQNRIEAIPSLSSMSRLRDDAVAPGVGLNLAFNRIDLNEGSSDAQVVETLQGIDGLSVRTEPQTDPEFSAQSLFAQSRVVRGEWIINPWFGLFNQKLGRWIFHRLHGWMYVRGSSDEEGLWFHNGSLGWLWANNATRGWFYSYSRQSWIYFDRGGEGQRWLFDRNQGAWVLSPAVR